MSIVGGLVHSEAEHATHHSPAGEWALRHAWGLILAGSAAFWLMLATILIWG